MLSTSNCQRALEVGFRFCRCLCLWRLKYDFPGNAMHLRLAPFFLRPFYFVYRVVNGTPSIVKLAKFRIRHCQIKQMPRFMKSCSS